MTAFGDIALRLERPQQRSAMSVSSDLGQVKAD